jgi:hypothetical protein
MLPKYLLAQGFLGPNLLLYVSSVLQLGVARASRGILRSFACIIYIINGSSC